MKFDGKILKVAKIAIRKKNCCGGRNGPKEGSGIIFVGAAGHINALLATPFEGQGLFLPWSRLSMARLSAALPHQHPPPAPPTPVSIRFHIDPENSVFSPILLGFRTTCRLPLVICVPAPPHSLLQVTPNEASELVLPPSISSADLFEQRR